MVELFANSMIRCCILIWVCTVCLIPVEGSPVFSGTKHGWNREKKWENDFSLECLILHAILSFSVPCERNPCNSIPCMNQGTCLVLGPDLFECHCLKGYTGIFLYHDNRQNRANSVDPDQMPHNVASNLGLHCLSLIMQYFRGRIQLMTLQCFIPQSSIINILSSQNDLNNAEKDVKHQIILINPCPAK